MNIYTSFPWNQSFSWLGAVWYILLVIGLWMTFEKAGEAGWKALIPFYNFYILFKICGMPMLFWVQVGCTAAAAVVYFISRLLFFLYPVGWILSIAAVLISALMWVNLAKAFGYGMGFALGLIFLNPIFIMILGYGGSRYHGSPLRY